MSAGDFDWNKLAGLATTSGGAIGHCTCQHRSCPSCWVSDAKPWAPPLSDFMFNQQISLAKAMDRLNKPRFKRHFDGNVTPLPSYAAQVIGAIRL